jgi:hypothetical protein
MLFINNKKFLTISLSIVMSLVYVLPFYVIAQDNGAGNLPGPYLPSAVQPVNQNTPSFPAYNPLQVTGGLNIAANQTDKPLVPCGNSVVDANGVTKIPIPCDFDYFILMINNIIKWIISIAGAIFTISAIYGGFLWMTSGGDSGKKGKARDILWNTLLGFVTILVAWLIVYTLLTYIVPTNSTIFKFISG